MKKSPAEARLGCFGRGFFDGYSSFLPSFLRFCLFARCSIRSAFFALAAERRAVSLAIKSFKSFSKRLSKIASKPYARRAFKNSTIAFIPSPLKKSRNFLSEAKGSFPAQGIVYHTFSLCQGGSATFLQNFLKNFSWSIKTVSWLV